ncbi:MAG TPA: type II toxin-antitoxin system VapC family toxin [Solirubrobacterales bacterium]|nr:type II toxin-antitoxin system VapC family toxin [Solirubrobacterales bacterium]
MSERRPARGLLDTSIFVALEEGRPLRQEALPWQNAISIVTRAELRVGVLAADDIASRDRRITTFEASRRFTVLSIDEEVGSAWAQMRAYVRASGQKVGVNDMWIAATAAAHEIPVLTQDGDFDALNGVAGLTVIPV